MRGASAPDAGAGAGPAASAGEHAARCSVCCRASSCSRCRPELGEGDGIVAYTDGVTDQGPEEGLPPERALADRPPDAGAEQLVDVLEALSRSAAGPYRDDLAILALRFVG